jgi:hypothetical protein
MKKSLLFVIFLLSLSTFSFAQHTNVSASLTHFYNTIQKMELSKDGGSTWFTVFDNNTSQIDLVALNGQNVGTILGTTNIPAGYYNNIRVTISDSSVVFSLTCNDDSATGTLTLDFANPGGGTPVSFPMTVTDDIGLTISEGGTTTCVMDFDAATSYVSSFIHQSGSTFTPGSGFTFNPQIQGRE